MKLTPKLLKLILNFYPPYIGAGVKISHISEDWSELHVSMALRWYNKNALGTHFGGSLYSMVDPHLVLLLMQLLGKDYLVWDKSADIDFIKPGKNKVSAVLKISKETLEEIKTKTAEGDKYFPEFLVNIHDENNELVARVNKTLYVKKKSPK
ncbi:YiiD C-terminal domain-containing protein [Parahaliea sp. F7430]|uniref:YiiD C-terminal domain-containing protein n=1 Tax=Sediminihaliea albiluteola TaxID=2758564 RepID=A0A7W2YK57_9GAMM|nr:DUF4442 domain-containing protein [Sediminihaliea albiluteola]MBA6413329.1 YiiD C-terminal domain-containing protein [Sediminihaliea albiluteola]